MCVGGGGYDEDCMTQSSIFILQYFDFIMENAADRFRTPYKVSWYQAG